MNKTIVDSKLASPSTSDAQQTMGLLVFIVQQNLVRISAVMSVIFKRRLEIHVTRRRCENMTLSTKPEIKT